MLICEIEQSLQTPQSVSIKYLQSRQFERLASEQLVHLFKVILVNVQVAEGVNEIADFKSAHVSYEVSKQSVTANVERYAEKGVSTALVELAMKRCAIFDLELKQRMARRQGYVVTYARVPTADQQPPRIRIFLYFLYQSCDLVDAIELRILSAK